MRRLRGYPQWFYATSLAVLATLFVSGLLLLPDMLDMRLEWDMPFRIGGGLRITSAALHSTAGFLSLSVLGALATLHVRVGWYHRRNRWSGVTLLVLFALLLVSAIGIYYLGDPAWSRGSSVLHTLAGFALTALFAWHLLNGRRIRLSRV